MESKESILMSSRMLAMENYIKGSGTKRQEKETELVFSSGLTDPNMKVCGVKIRPMVKEE